MGKLVAVSPVGKNGQTVVPASIRRIFRITPGHNLVGFYVQGRHVEIAPVSVEREDLDYTEDELDQLERLAKEKGGRRFKTATEAKKYLGRL
ncbi:MAG: AbrB/MazE/SpoVT family DNA-binding domain-containing protein [Elusimicrobia bacterium]|nr:AbrB/MazE/SpoVT family DNA-binding domain-containing protein [Elusimicrobiota bacterium]